MAESQRSTRDAEFRSLVEEIPAVTYIADFVGEFSLRYVSPQCKAILGFSPEDWVADPDAWVRALHPDDRDRIVAAAEECIETERPFDFEYRMIAADGRVVHLWEKTSIVRDTAGRAVAVNGVMLDVTDLKVAQEALLVQQHERATERAEYETVLRRQLAENQHQAMHDDLTALANRRQLKIRLESATRRQTPHALLLIDLDRFKDVNDALGHHCGDELLRLMAVRLRRVVRDADVLARLGGDEFAIVLPRVRGGRQARTVAERITDSLAEPFTLDDLPVYVEASIGIALSPEHGSDSQTLLRAADVAMYQAKGNGTGWSVFAPESDDTPMRVSRLAELREAIGTGQLTLRYQPKLGLTRHQVIGVEALIRWNHPALGMLPPSEFLPLAEQTGLIRPLTTFVLTESLRTCGRWREQGLSLTMAVNIAPRSLADNRLAPEVAELLRAHDVPPELLELEITETGLLHEPKRSLQTLTELHEIGVRLSIDDFGTGYSSLSRLRDLPVDHLKIDRSFVTPMDSDFHGAQIVKSTIALGHSLGMEVIAEGVEDGLVLDRLISYGCDAAQGYYIGRPMLAKDVERMIETASAQHAPSQAA